MGRTANDEQQARAADGLRRIALECDRAACDDGPRPRRRRPSSPLGERDDVMRQVWQTELRVGDAVPRITAEGFNFNVGGAAQLCDLTVGDVRRFRRAAQDLGQPRGDAATSGAPTAVSADVREPGPNDVADDSPLRNGGHRSGRDAQRRGSLAMEVAERVRASTSAQGLPERVEDPDILMAVGAAINRARQSTPSAHRIGSHARIGRPDVPAPQLRDSRAS